MAFALFPLSYQTDSASPFLPQERFLACCAERGLAWLDLLPELPAASAETPPWIDDWYPTPGGHAVVAAEIELNLPAAGLLAEPAPGP